MREQKGQAIVEVALILPLLLLILFGIFDFGRTIYIMHCLSNAASLAARRAAVTPSLIAQAPVQLTSAPVTPPVTAATNELNSLNGLFSITPDVITYELKRQPSASSPTAQPGEPVQVILSWNDFRFVTPIKGILEVITGTSQSPFTPAVKGEATMRYE